MSRFMKESDYAGRIKNEIKKMLVGIADPTDTTSVPPQLLLAENTAISTIRKYIGAKCNCDLIFIPDTASAGQTDTRDLFIVKCIISLALYDLYGQTGAIDVPQHRKDAYDDTIQWLKDVGRGAIDSGLPAVSILSNSGDIRINSRPPNNHKW